MILNILISTLNDRILGLRNIITDESNVIFTVSHQVNQDLSKESLSFVASLEQRVNVIYSQITSIGVAINRNNSLKHRVKGAICLLCDDDVVYFKDSFERIIQEFQKDNTLEFLTFKIKTFSGKDYKDYKSYEFKHTLKTLSIIGIIDVAFKEEVIDKYNLRFDERFGPGGEYSIGEDFIFMTDAIVQKANIVYKPIDIVQHEDIGTGRVLRDDIIFGRGAMFFRVFGKLSFLVNIYFSIKNKKKYNSKYTFWEYNKLLFKGNRDYAGKKL